MTRGTARAIRINARDNCAVLLADVRTGEPVEVRSDEGTSRLEARQAIALGHKIALEDLAADQPIIKYGEEIGRAGSAIAAGDWIHLHNVYCLRGRDRQ